MTDLVLCADGCNAGTDTTDCSGVCGGNAVVDECGLCDGPGADVMCDDGSMVCDESECPTSGGGVQMVVICQQIKFSYHPGDVYYNIDTDIAGFQFSVEGTTSACSRRNSQRCRI